jgi:hypothetical protein
LLNSWKKMPAAAQDAMRNAATECFRSKFDSRIASRKFINALESLAATPAPEAVHA